MTRSPDGSARVTPAVTTKCSVTQLPPMYVYDLVRSSTVRVMVTVSASDARQTLPAQLDRVEAGEEVEITRHGRVVAVLIRPEALAARRHRALQVAADALSERLDQARSAPLPEAGLSHERANELVRLLRTDRSID